MGYKLTVMLNGRTVEWREVDQERFVIGRSPGCDLVIDNLGVSRQHAEIVLSDSNVPVLKDLGSNNGTFVDGKRVAKYALNDGDSIAVGKFVIVYTGELATGSDVFPRVRSEPDVGSMTMELDARLEARKQLERASKIKGYLQVASGGEKRTVNLDQSLTLIGKLEDCDILVTGWGMSPRHAAIFRDDEGFTLVHLGNKGETLLNGIAVGRERLAMGDQIQVGRTELTFMAGAPPA